MLVPWNVRQIDSILLPRKKIYSIVVFDIHLSGFSLSVFQKTVYFHIHIKTLIVSKNSVSALSTASGFSTIIQ